MHDTDLKTNRTSPHDAKAFLLSSIVLSGAVFKIAFWFGVSGTVFFEHLFHVWIAATVALAASVFVPHISALPQFLSWRGRFVLILPTLWLALELFIGPDAVLSAIQQWFVWGLAMGMLVLTLPYIAYVLVTVTVPDIERLHSARLGGAILGIALLTAFAGLAIGHNHPRILTCSDFEIAGDHVPANCTPSPLDSNKLSRS